MTGLELIENKLRSHSASLPDDSIFGGKSGAAIISAFISEEDLSNDLLLALNGLIAFGGGDVSTEIWKLWCVSLLLQHDLVNLPEGYSFSQMVNNVVKRTRHFCYDSPVKITRRMDLYPFGLVGLKALDNLDGIPFYVMVEQIVLYMRDCEFFLTRGVPYVHDNQKLKASILHSTLRFMQLAEQKKVFTWKASQLQDYIKTMAYDTTASRPVDIFILDYLAERNVDRCEWTSEELCYIGTIAFLYDSPGLFTAAWMPTTDLENLPTESLVGIGLGLLTNKLHGTDL